MKVESVHAPAFSCFGRVIEGYDFAEFIEVLKTTPCPEAAVVYKPSEPALEALPVAKELSSRFYGGMPIQIGYCNGYNGALNCLEYHRDSEINVFATDAILLVSLRQKMREGHLDTDWVAAFAVPAGTAVELYATTLHYAPCCVDRDSHFQASIILPKGTNTEKPEIQEGALEDRMLWAKNKWLIAHPDAPEAAEGAFVGLDGENIHLF